MPAYFVAIRSAVKDPAELEIYQRKSPASAAGRHIKRLATSSNRLRSTAGAAPDGVSILEFRSFEEAEDWYDSPEYQEAVRHLFRGADYQTFIVEGGVEMFGEWLTSAPAR
jgi:uncharacterized protein (DUF1330 family)